MAKRHEHFYNEVMKIFINNLEEQEIHVLKEAFKTIDKDNTGLIRPKELEKEM